MIDKIFTAQQVRDADAFTIHHQCISSLQLMEQAAEQCLVWIKNQFNTNTTFLIMCGMGNNGGDGLALTRLLLQEGFKAKAVVLKLGEEFTTDTSTNLKLLHQLAPDCVQIIQEGQFLYSISNDIVLIDAIFGIGLNRPLHGWVAQFVASINSLNNLKIAIDLPSGLSADGLPKENEIVLKADYTLSFQYYKRAFLHVETAKYVGQVAILDIGISTKYTKATHSQYRIITKELVIQRYRPRLPFTHKGHYGKAMIIGGAYGKIGALLLATKAALRTGAGLVYVQAPECGYNVLQASAPEAMFVNAGVNVVTQIDDYNEQFHYGVGMGLGTDEATVKAFSNFVSQAQRPLVIDADGINILSQHKSLLQKLPPKSIITPHLREFERLFGKAENSMLCVECARVEAMKYQLIIILKGHHTAVVLPNGECLYNINGNAGMATGGSGDVLSGIITSLLAQGYSSKDAAIMGVYLHGRAGDIAARLRSPEALIASDIIDHLGDAFLELAK